MTTVLGLLSWDPEIRNILALAVGVLILCGSVILLISTNTGPRTGLLVGLAVLLGWMTIMGLIWWMYGIGMKGSPSHWRVLNINVGNLQDDPLEQARKLQVPNEQKVVSEILAKHPELEDKVNPDHIPNKIITIGDLVDTQPSLLEEFHLTPKDLNGWNLLPTSNPQRGDAQAVADSALVPASGQKIFPDTASYKVLEAFDIGGKNNEHRLPPNPSMWDRVKTKIAKSIELTHPEHYLVLQVQGVVPQVTPPGGKPPTPKIDPTQPVISVVMIRSLGDLRFPGFMMFLVCGILFAVTCNTLHRRDKLIARNRAMAAA